MDQVGVRALVGAVAGLSLVSACGAGEVTESSEYVSLSAENDELSTELEDARIELGVAELREEELGADLAESEQEAASVRSDFGDYLATVFERTGGLTEGQAGCLSRALVDDADARAAYLVLLMSTDPNSSEATAAYDSLGGVFDDCDLELPGADSGSSTDSAAELPQELVDVIRPVEVTGVALPVLPASGADPAVGLPAPVLVGEDYDGNPVRIDAMADGSTMVVLLAHWCPHCNAEIPRLNQLQELGRIPDGVNIIGISSAVNPTRANFPPDAWLSEMEWGFPVIADGIDLELDRFIGSNAFGVTGVPFVTLIDGDGNVAERWAGERDPDSIVDALTALVATG